MLTIKRINPQPRLPVVSYFRGEREYGPGHEGWWYQSPETDRGLTFNAPWPFNDPDGPGRIGETYDGQIIENVTVFVKNGIAYWAISLTE